MLLPVEVIGGYQLDQDLMTDKNEIIVSITAENRVENLVGRKVPIYLVIQCGSDSTTWAHVHTGDILKTEGNAGKEYDYLHQNTFIKLRWDGAKPITETWTIANNGKQAATKNTNQFIKSWKKFKSNHWMETRPLLFKGR